MMFFFGGRRDDGHFDDFWDETNFSIVGKLLKF
jgi:hypothetical protein